MPRQMIGARLRFADGTVSRIYRETVMRNLATSRMSRSSFDFVCVSSARAGLATPCLFRVLFNTLLFAAHRGLPLKLWLTDRGTDFYRGIYEWEDQDSAIEYVETLRVRDGALGGDRHF